MDEALQELDEIIWGLAYGAGPITKNRIELLNDAILLRRNMTSGVSDPAHPQNSVASVRHDRKSHTSVVPNE